MTPFRHWTTFDALRDRKFRWLWVGQLASSVATPYDVVAHASRLGATAQSCHEAMRAQGRLVLRGE